MKYIEAIDYGGFFLLVSKINGKTLEITKADFQDKYNLNILLKEYKFFDEIKVGLNYSKDLFRTIYISLHISSNCNMKCTYCFSKERSIENLTFEQSKKFIDAIISEYPNAGKYIVDPTGSGEPLLNKSLLYMIGEYCKIKSNEINKEVLPMIVTNGTLLDKQTVEEIREAGILFGVSIDGKKIENDFYREDYQGNSVYKTVMKNIKSIKDRSLMGAAVTLTDKNIDLVKTLKHLIKYFPTISIKPVRSSEGKVGINTENIESVKKEYTRLFRFLVAETKRGNVEYIAALLNGDDYFGKFLLRTILNQKVSTRCDAGIGRFSLAQDGRIYVCPGAVDIEKMVVGNLSTGIDTRKRDEFWKLLVGRKLCIDCFARFVCGGECMVSSYYISGEIDQKEDVMCTLKKHLYKLSLLFKSLLQQTSYYESLYLACVEKNKRFQEDLEVTRYLEKNPEVKFMDVKMNREKYI